MKNKSTPFPNCHCSTCQPQLYIDKTESAAKPVSIPTLSKEYITKEHILSLSLEEVKALFPIGSKVVLKDVSGREEDWARVGDIFTVKNVFKEDSYCYLSIKHESEETRFLMPYYAWRFIPYTEKTDKAAKKTSQSVSPISVLSFPLRKALYKVKRKKGWFVARFNNTVGDFSSFSVHHGKPFFVKNTFVQKASKEEVQDYLNGDTE